MARWRPPTPGSSPYITAAGARALDAELKQLWRRRREDIVPALQAAAAEGDRSENAEYTYRKRQLAEVDRRIRYLAKRLDEIEVVAGVPRDCGKAFFGAVVTLRDESGQTCSYRIVGADETDAAKGWISVDSPLARALLGRREGEMVEVLLPQRRVVYKLSEITYPDT